MKYWTLEEIKTKVEADLDMRFALILVQLI